MYNLAVASGTFDHFHKGHESFLLFTLRHTKSLLLGVTSDSYVQNEKKIMFAQTYLQRKRNVEEFLRQNNVGNRVQIVPIDSVYIPKDWEHLPLESIVVTEETEKGAFLVNEKRHKEGLPALVVLIAPLVNAFDDSPISSSRIRSGEITRDGKAWVRKEWRENTLVLPDDVRAQLKEPLGELITDFSRWVETNAIFPQRSVTVGDVITKTFNDMNIVHTVSVVDLRVERQDVFSDIFQLGFTQNDFVITAQNPAGKITPSLWKSVEEALILRKEGKRIVVFVEGEEDLVVLPVVLAAPLGYTVFYGQPKVGVVAVFVDEIMKEKAYSFVANFVVQD